MPVGDNDGEASGVVASTSYRWPLVVGDRRGAEELNAKGHQAQEQGDNKHALDLYLQAIKEDSTYTQAWFNLACMEASEGDVEEAIGALNNVQSLAPDEDLAVWVNGCSGFNEIRDGERFSGWLSTLQRSGHCLEADALVGKWRFTNFVKTASKTDWIGNNNFYEMVIKRSEKGLDATLIMTGYTPDVRLPRHRQYRGKGRIALGCHEARVDLVLSRPGDDAEMSFIFSPEGLRLQGLWYYRSSTWKRHGAYGALAGKEGHGARLYIASSADLPCEARCRQDHGRPERPEDNGIGWISEGALDGCLGGCR